MEIKPQLIRNLQIGGIIVALALVGFGIYQTVGNMLFPTSDDKSKQSGNAEVAVRSTAPTEPLPYLPKDFPIDNSTVVQNYTVTSPKQTDAQQYTRSYTSKRSIAELYKTYSDYLKRNSWTILNAVQTKGGASINAVKEKVVVSVAIQDLGSSRMVVITVGESSQSLQPDPNTLSGSNAPTIKP